MNKFNLVILFVAAVIVIFIIYFFIIGATKDFFSLDFVNSPHGKNRLVNLNKEFVPSSSLSQITLSSTTATTSNIFVASSLDPKLALLNFQFYADVEEKFAEIVKKTRKAKTLDIEAYRAEIQKISKKFKQYGDIKITDADKAANVLFALVDELSNANPPEIVYDTHLNLIKKYLTLAMALKAYNLTISQAEKNAIYNIIIITLKQLSVN